MSDLKRSAMKYLELTDRQYRALIGAGVGLVFGIIVSSFIIIISGHLRDSSFHALILPGSWIMNIFIDLGLAPYGERSLPLVIMAGIIFWPFSMTGIGGILAYATSKK